MSFQKRLLFIILGAGIFVVGLNLFLASRNLQPEKEKLSQADNAEVLQTPSFRNENRKQRIQRLCQQYHLGDFNFQNGSNALKVKEPPSAQYSYYFVFRNERLNLAWCPVYKAGSTTWLHHMLTLKGFSEDFLQNPPKQLSLFAREVLPEAEPNEAFAQSTKILIVRHPFERLVSAYVDKLSNASANFEHGTKHYYEKYGRKIVKKFRTDHSLQQIEPTFEEFVRYLLHEKLELYADDHWLPAYLGCTPCRVKFDFIGKVETYQGDQEYVIEQLDLKLKPSWQHRTGEVGPNTGDRVSNRSRRYFSQLTRSQIEELHTKYYLDFELFEYRHEAYLSLAKL